MTAELKPCPFCGGEASASGYIKYGKPLEDVFWDDGLPITEAFFCNCIACGVTNINGRIGHQTRETSIAAWNTRANLPQSAALAERDKQVRDDTVRSAAIAAGNAIVAIAADADPDISPLRKQMLRVKMEKAVKAAFTRDA